MKKRTKWILVACVALALLLILLFSLADRQHENSGEDADADTAIDYGITYNWAYFALGDDKAVDLFLICPTVDMRDEYNMSLEDTETKANFLGALNMERGLYEDSARMFAPYSR